MNWRDFIPFIGFREENIDDEGIPCEEYTGWKSSTFQLRWLGYALVFVGDCYYVEEGE